MHPFPISQPHICVPFQKLDVTMPPALLPTPGKQNLRKRGQSWEGWTASPCHDWQQEVPHKSEVSRLTALSVQNTHSDAVPRRCLLSKPTANRPSEKHSSYCRVSTTVETGKPCPLWLMPLKWTHLAIKPCCSSLSPASGSLATVPENPNTPICTVLGHSGEGRGGMCLWEIRLATEQMVPLVIPKATPITLPGSVSRNHRLSSPTLFILQMKKRMFREVWQLVQIHGAH